MNLFLPSTNPSANFDTPAQAGAYFSTSSSAGITPGAGMNADGAHEGAETQLAGLGHGTSGEKKQIGTSGYRYCPRPMTI